jgi:hypothetical protein
MTDTTEDPVVNGYAVSFTELHGWSYRAVTSDMPLDDNETFYRTYAEFPQEARDWFDSHL